MVWKACFGVLTRHSVVQGLNVTVATRQHLIPAGLWDLGALQAHFKGPPQQDVRPQLSASSIVLFPMLLTSTAASSCGFTTTLEHLEVWKIAYQGNAVLTTWLHGPSREKATKQSPIPNHVPKINPRDGAVDGCLRSLGFCWIR